MDDIRAFRKTELWRMDYRQAWHRERLNPKSRGHKIGWIPNVPVDLVAEPRPGSSSLFAIVGRAVFIGLELERPDQSLLGAD